MSAAAVRIYRGASLPRRLQALAVVAYLVVFLIFVSAGGPGLGIGQGFHIPIILVALGGTALAGVAAGLVAGALYAIGLGLEGSTGLLSVRFGVHLLTYVGAGALIGYAATRARSMLSDALGVLDELLRLARRDLDTGLLDRHGLDRALAERIGGHVPFTLLVGEIECADGDDDEALRRAARSLLRRLEDGAEAARIGPSHFAFVTIPGSLAAARTTAAALERALEADGGRATFGWTVHPTEGRDPWTLFRAANERLYARRIVRGEWTPTAASAGLADDLIQPA
jgi:GGDEF domain-containing protein